MIYTIEESTAKSLANQVRRLTGTTDEMSTREMAVKLVSVAAGSGSSTSGFPNGTQWTIGTGEIVGILALKYGNGTWFCVSHSGFYYSLDGKTWKPCDVELEYDIQIVDRYVDFGDGLWIVSNHSDGFYTSEDGITWTKLINSEHMSTGGCGIKYANGLWIAGSATNGIFYSEDGKTWVQSNITSDGGQYISFEKGMYFCNDWKMHYYSYDGKTWESVPQSNSELEYVNYGKGLFVGANHGFVYSTDGITWTQSNISMQYGHAYCPIVYESGLFVGSIVSNGIYYSDDGKIWVQSNVTNVSVWGISKSNGIWVATTTAGIYYSLDGKVWVKSNISTYCGFGVPINKDGIWVASTAYYESSPCYSVTWEP